MELVKIGGGFLNNFIIKTDKGLIVIDTGMDGGFEKFKARFIKHGFDFSDIRFIFITHTHQDHVGFLKKLTDVTDAEIILHKDGVERLKTGRIVTDGVHFTRQGRFLNSLTERVKKGEYDFEPVDAPQRYLVFENDEQYFKNEGIDIEIIALPGHTKDSIGLLLMDGTLICGDSAMNNIFSPKNRSVLIEDIDMYKNTWKKIIELNPRKILPSHGREFNVSDLVKHIKFIKNLPRQ